MLLMLYSTRMVHTHVCSTYASQNHNWTRNVHFLLHLITLLPMCNECYHYFYLIRVLISNFKLYIIVMIFK